MELAACVRLKIVLVLVLLVAAEAIYLAMSTGRICAVCLKYLTAEQDII